MRTLNILDYVAIVSYVLALLVIGIYLKRRASKSLEDYFLAGRKMPWWALGISGMAQSFDLTGTMVITSFLFLLGPRGIYIEGFRCAAGIMLVIALLWGGKWHRRSQCMTGAEWLIFRFGDGLGGRFAALSAAIAAVIVGIGMISYLAKGVGLFLAMFLPFSPFTCSIMLFIVATFYTMISGFYGVVFADILQSSIVIVGVIIIATLAIIKVPDGASLSALAYKVTNNADWLNALPSWNTSMPQGYETYQCLTLFALLYLFRNVVGGLSMGGEPRYFAARSDRDCGIQTFFTINLLSTRWLFAMALAVLGVYLVSDIFSSQSQCAEAAAMIKAQHGLVNKAQWGDLLSHIVNRPDLYSKELISGLQSNLGNAWQSKLQLISYEGTINPEQILPAVISSSIPMGLRGLMVVVMIAASMSACEWIINMTTAFFTRDIYSRYIRCGAADKELVYASWIFSVFLVTCGFLMAYTAKNINDIWGWICMGLGIGPAAASILRLYWWRINGAGFAIGTVVGLVAALIQRAFFPGLGEIMQFVVLSIVGLFATVVGTYLTKPTDVNVVKNFYCKTRPFGFWGPFKKYLADDVRIGMQREHRNDLLAMPFTLLWHISLLFIPMLFIVRNFKVLAADIVLCLAGLAGMYLFWYRNLPPVAAEEPETAPVPQRTQEKIESTVNK
jgi:Na+/proline symporter